MLITYNKSRVDVEEGGLRGRDSFLLKPPMSGDSGFISCFRRHTSHARLAALHITMRVRRSD